MGCPCSKLEESHCEEEEDYCQAISQCKQRKEFLRHASQARSAFARANAEFLQALARTGSALQEFSKGGGDGGASDPQPRHEAHRFALEYVPLASQRVVVNQSTYRSPPCQQYFNGVLFKPPPPPPGCSSRYWDSDYLQKYQRAADEEKEVVVSCKEVQEGEDEEEDTVEVEGDEVKLTYKYNAKSKHHHGGGTFSQSSSCSDLSSQDISSHDNVNLSDLAIVPAELSSKELEEIFRYLHQEFVKASRSGVVVGKMLESSNGTELGLLGASSKALTWRNEDVGILGDESNLSWSQALTLETLSAWELKLYEEVKALSGTHAEFNKKRKLLCKYGVNRVHDETVDKTRADVKAVETQMLVATQATEATAAAIQKITNEELHFQLVELVHELADMWRTIRECHERQRSAVLALKLSRDLEGFTSGNRSSTYKLQTALSSWQASLCTLVSSEKEYIRSLSRWLDASIRRGNLSRRQARSLHLAIPEIFYLCQEWEKSLGALLKQQQHSGGESLREVKSMLSRVEASQTQEMKARKCLQKLAKELNKKAVNITNLEKRKEGSGVVSDKKATMECLKQQVEMEKGEYERLSRATRCLVLETIEKGLPKLFQGAFEVAKVCMETHEELYTRAKHGIKLTVIK